MMETREDNQLAQDVDTIAHAEIVAEVEYALTSGDISHESCPDIGAHDWDLIAERIKEIIKELTPDDTKRADAYARLIERAD